MRLAYYHAKSLLKQLGITSLPINPYDICVKMGILIKEDDCEGYTGMLLVVADRALISVKSSIREQSRKRYTVAHELGHYNIPEHLAGGKTSFKCTNKDLDTFDKKGMESEANEFAAELLMPEKIFKEKIRLKDLSYNLLHDLTFEFETSLTATAIRFVKLSGNYALVCSEKFCIKWVIRGEDFPFYIRGDGKLDQESLAIDYFNGKGLPKSFETVPANAWLEEYRPKADIETQELSIALPHYNQVLSFLYAEPAEEDEEDEYLEELNGYPKFRR